MAVIRKGKERFVCDARLAERASLVQPSRKKQRNSLRIAENILDMDHIPELSRYDRCRICVPQSCPRDCFMRLDCRYQQYLRDSMKPDIQICNHNYLLADASHRQEDRPLLLRSYQALVVDEAHKLPDAARQMYTETLSPHNMDELCLLLQQVHYKDFARQLRTAILTLSFSCTQGLSKLRRKVSEPFVLTPFRRAALIDCIALLQNACRLPDVPRYLLNRLGEAESLLRLFLLEVPTRILYIIVNSCMEQKSGTEFWRPALFAMLTAVQQGRVNAVIVQSLDRLSHDITTLYRILRFLQNYGAVLITTETNLQYELYLTGLESRILARAARNRKRVPWEVAVDAN